MLKIQGLGRFCVTFLGVVPTGIQEVFMKKAFGSLPFRLLLGIAAGIVCGLFFGEGIMKVVVTLKYIMGQIITFCVPLIVIGFIAPSITKLGSNASRMLTVALLLAYVSSICADLPVGVVPKRLP